MKQNFITKLLTAKLTILIVCCLAWNSSLTGQTQSTTCFFVGETLATDQLPTLNIPLAPGSCQLCSVGGPAIPTPALNTPGCASIQDRRAGPVVQRDNTGCTFAEACNSCFGCNIVTTTSVRGPALFASVAPQWTGVVAGNPASCETWIPAAQLRVEKGGTASFRATYQLQIAPAAGGPFTNITTSNGAAYTSGNGVRQDYNFGTGTSGNFNPISLYTPCGNNFIRPTAGWGVSTTFGECVPTFQFYTGGAAVAAIDSTGASDGCGAAGLVCLSGGSFSRVYRSWSFQTGTTTCLLVRGVLPVNIQDLEPPTFVPSCPKGNLVSLNAGPGECEVSWDAPQFMAMDNCPANSTFGAGAALVTGCPSVGRYASVEGLTSGIMFDLRNIGTSAVGIVGLRSWFCHSSPPTTIPDADYQFWIKSTANTGWRTGVVGALAGNGGCNSGANWPLSQWTLAATSATHKAVPNGIRLGDNRITARTWVLNGANQTNTDTFDLRSAQVTSRTVCGRTMNDTAIAPALVLQPGEIRGCLIAGAPGSGNSMWADNFNSCLAQTGNASLAINPTGSNGLYITHNSAAQIGGNFHCASWGYEGDIFTAVGGNMIIPTQYCGQPYAPGCFFPIGCTKLCYRATDAQGNVATCEFNVCVNAYSNPTNALACNDDIQLSLDDNCSITLNADMFLEGGPYKCYDAYRVQARLWSTTGTGGLIDRQPNVPGVQLNGSDIGHELKITIIDTATGNSCWSHATVEDKLPPRLTCAPNITVSCAAGILPAVTGTPQVAENCGGVSLTYRDNATKGNCQLGYAWKIIRTWTAVDGSGNRSTCVQNITVGIGDVFDITVPGNWDNIQNPMLACDQKIDRNKNVTPHMSDFPECVDGYILDSAFWRANPTQPDIYPNRRLPRVLGWNCVDDPNDNKYTHPSPDPTTAAHKTCANCAAKSSCECPHLPPIT